MLQNDECVNCCYGFCGDCISSCFPGEQPPARNQHVGDQLCRLPDAKSLINPFIAVYNLHMALPPPSSKFLTTDGQLMLQLVWWFAFAGDATTTVQLALAPGESEPRTVQKTMAQLRIGDKVQVCRPRPPGNGMAFFVSPHPTMAS